MWNFPPLRHNAGTNLDRPSPHSLHLNALNIRVKVKIGFCETFGITPLHAWADRITSLNMVVGITWNIPIESGDGGITPWRNTTSLPLARFCRESNMLCYCQSPQEWSSRFAPGCAVVPLLSFCAIFVYLCFVFPASCTPGALGLVFTHTHTLCVQIQTVSFLQERQKTMW